MSDKLNIYIEQEELDALGKDSVSGQITRALKQAYNHPDDFIRYAKNLLSQKQPMDDFPKPAELLERGMLRYNLYADFAGIKLFIAKGTKAELKGSELKTNGLQISLVDSKLSWDVRENDFNADRLCVLVTPGEEELHHE